MKDDKVALIEREALEKARAAGRYQIRRPRRKPWVPHVAPEPSLRAIRWATKDVALAAFLAAQGVRPIVAANLLGPSPPEPIYGFEAVPEEELKAWETVPADHVKERHYRDLRMLLRDRTRAARRAGLETVLLRLDR